MSKDLLKIKDLHLASELNFSYTDGKNKTGYTELTYTVMIYTEIQI